MTRRRTARRAGLLIAAAATVAIGVLTLTPGAGGGAQLPITCLWCDQYALQDALLNVLLFVPLGIGLGVAFPRRTLASAAAMAGFTLAIEALQLHVVGGRDPSLRDVVTNALGGVAGLAIGVRWRLLLAPHPRRAWRLVAGARIAWVAVNLLAAWLLVPVDADEPTQMIAGTHVGGLADFQGRVVRWSFTPKPPVGAPPDGFPLLHAAAIVNPGPRVAALTPVLVAMEPGAVHRFMLALQGDDAVFHVRTRADVARLPSPRMRFPDVVKPWYRTLPPPRNVLDLEAARYGARGAVKVAAPTGGIVEASVPVRSTQAWALLVPGGYELRPGLDPLSAAWCFLLLLPTGYWTGQTGHHRRSLAWSLAGIAAASGLAMGPLFFSQAIPPWTDLAGSALGLGAGALLALLATRRRR